MISNNLRCNITNADESTAPTQERQRSTVLKSMMENKTGKLKQKRIITIHQLVFTVFTASSALSQLYILLMY